MSIFNGMCMVLQLATQKLISRSTTKEELLELVEVLEGQVNVLREVANGMEDGDNIASL